MRQNVYIQVVMMNIYEQHINHFLYVQEFALKTYSEERFLPADL